MITEVSLLKRNGWFMAVYFCGSVRLCSTFFLGKAFIKVSFYRRKTNDSCVKSCSFDWSISYIGDFNNPQNLLRKAYNKTALWIPYSQK